MANIEVSLNTGGTAGKRRSEKLAQSAQEIIREIDSLKLTISNKDRLISKLKQHITDICGQVSAQLQPPSLPTICSQQFVLP